MHAEGGGGSGRLGWWRQAAGWLALAGLIGLFFWFRASEQAEPPSQPTVGPTADITVYFTQPESRDTSSSEAADSLVGAVLESGQSIDMAAYELDLAPLADALLSAEARRVRVRVVAESDEAERGVLPRLEAAGVPIVLDRRPSLMHDKFTVIDGREVWTGSMNYTFNGVYRNNNNLVRLRSGEAARRFTQEFEEMFVGDRFSALSVASQDREPLSLSNATVEILFSPDDHPESRIVEVIQSASVRVDFLAFTFTSDAIAEALLDRMRSGVPVRGVLEADQAQGTGSQYDRLTEGGVDLRLDGNPGLLHHKVIVIDGTTVITGSYNFSRSAETTNDENVVIIRSRQVAGAFQAEVDRLYADGLP